MSSASSSIVGPQYRLRVKQRLAIVEYPVAVQVQPASRRAFPCPIRRLECDSGRAQSPRWIALNRAGRRRGPRIRSASGQPRCEYGVAFARLIKRVGAVGHAGEHGRALAVSIL